MDNDFDFESGELCLDFANTNDWHASEHPEEQLHSYSDLIAWGEAAGVISPELADLLREAASDQPGQAEAAYQQAIALREAIYRLFAGVSEGSDPDPGDLAHLNTALQQAMQHLLVSPSGGEYRWSWDHAIEMERIGWPVSRSAAELLTSPLLRRVRRCEDDRGCGYLFIDTSRNRSRRWCSMESCGNRAKARRHYARQKEQER